MFVRLLLARLSSARWGVVGLVGCRYLLFTKSLCSEPVHVVGAPSRGVTGALAAQWRQTGKTGRWFIPR